MAAPKGRYGDIRSAILNPEATARPGAPARLQRLPRLGTELSCAAGRRTGLPNETPLPHPGKEGVMESSAEHLAAPPLPPTQDGGVLALPLAHSLTASPSSSGSRPPPPPPPRFSMLHNAAQQLRDAPPQPAVAVQQGKAVKAAGVAITRLLPQKQLEPFCVQAQPDQTRQKEKSVLRPSTVHSRNVIASQPIEKNPKMLELSVVNPQIIQLLPLTGMESQQFFICSSSEPTVPGLVQNPLPPLGQVSVAKILTHGQKNKPDATAAADSLNATLVLAPSENSLINHEKKEKEKEKLSLKVKTRSGRISQPPKYKIKDYKFIKTEDLADCHQSDSDDYSELSAEDDRGAGQEKAMCSFFDTLTYNLRPKLFKCPSCEKSYIGQGGLARHYKLNPDHRPQEPSHPSPTNRPLLVHSRKTSVKSDTSAKDKTFAPQLNRHRLYSGPGRRRQTGRSNKSKMTERSRHSGGFDRPGQFSSKSINNMSAEHHSVFRRKARLKELIEQSPNDDFMELAVPRLTTLVTVFEFLLKKVETKCPGKALFPDVYREFEELHEMITRMCQDYFSNPELKEPMEIKNPKVAESLGITNSCLKIQEIHTNSPSACIKTTCGHVTTETSGRKRASEDSDEILPVPKKTTVENLLKNIDYSNHSGMKERSIPFEEASLTTYIDSRSASAEDDHPSLEQEMTSDLVDQDLYDQGTEARHETLQPSSKSGFDCSEFLNLVE